MKKTFTLPLIAALLLSLSGCSLPSLLPAPAEKAPQATVEPEEVIPEEPGAGRILVHMRRDSGETAISGESSFTYSIYVPEVTVALRDGVDTAINKVISADAEELRSSVVLSDTAGEFTRTCTVPREDKHILSIVRTDTDPAGYKSVSAITFSTLTGEMLEFPSLCRDETLFRSLCTEYAAALTGNGDILPEDTADMVWYFSDEGLVILWDGSPFSIPYSVLYSALKDDYMPPEEETVKGTLRAAYTNDTAEDLDVLDELTVQDGFESVVLWAEGEIRNLSAVRVEGEAFSPRELIWACSRLHDGEGVRFNITLPEGIPDLKLTWTTDTGNFEALLSRNGETGKAGLLMVVGSEESAPARTNSPYAYITEDGFIGGHWSNELPGSLRQEISFQSKICYVWNGERSLNGACFLWNLEWPEDEGCPSLVIYTGGESGNLLYPIEELTDTSFTVAESGEVFTKAVAVG